MLLLLYRKPVWPSSIFSEFSNSNTKAHVTCQPSPQEALEGSAEKSLQTIFLYRCSPFPQHVFCVSLIPFFPTRLTYNCLHMLIILFQEYYYMAIKEKFGKQKYGIITYSLYIINLPSSLCLSDVGPFLHTFNIDCSFKVDFLRMLNWSLLSGCFCIDLLCPRDKPSIHNSKPFEAPKDRTTQKHGMLKWEKENQNMKGCLIQQLIL